MKPGLGVGVLVLKDNKVLLGLRNPDKVKASSELQGQKCSRTTPEESAWIARRGKPES